MERGGEGEVEGKEREGPQVTVEPGPLIALLRHCFRAIRTTAKHSAVNVEHLTGIGN